MRAIFKRSIMAAGAMTLATGATLAFVPRPVQVEVGRVVRGGLEVVVEGTGTTRVRERHVVAAPAAGQCGRIRLRPGDRVEAGQPVAVLMPAMPPILDTRARLELEARHAAARATAAQATAVKEHAAKALEAAARDLKRAEQLAVAGALTRQSLEQARLAADLKAEEMRAAELAERSALESARAAGAAARADAPEPARGAGVTVSAPVSGSVLRVAQESEAPVTAGTVLLEIGDPTALEAVVELLTTEAVHVRRGAAVELVRWGGTERLGGTVRRVEPAAFTKVSALGVEEQRVNVLVDPAAGTTWDGLGDGYHVEARITVWQGSGVLKAPAAALLRDGPGWKAWVVNDGRVHARSVRLGRRAEREVEVLSGLIEGDRVVLYPGVTLAEDTRVASAS